MTDQRPIDRDRVLPVGTVTLLLADVEGSTRLWETEPDFMAAAVARLEEVVTEVIGRRGGVRPVEQGEGDSFVAAFARASDGLAAAIDLQRANLDPIRLRIGIHTGEAQLRDEGNYMGSAVNRTARIRDLGHGGQTLLSRATHDLVADRLPEGTWLVDLGGHRLRDLERPEQVHQLCAPDLPIDFPPLRSLDARPNNLPVQLTSFIGREQEIAAVRRLVTRDRLVTLTGSGGCGKTRLALQVAAEVVEDHDDGVWWVDLAPAGDPGLVPIAVGQAMGIREVAGEDLTATLARLLAGRRTLVVLDNCEHVIDASAALCHALLLACPQVVVLATSREPLGVIGETTWRVPSLTLPATIEALDSRSDCEAVRLFVDRARQARPTFDLTADNASEVAQICSRLDGIPLAIELAASRVRVLTPEQIASGLDERFRLLSGSSRTSMPRQRTLEASVDWSYNLLTDDQRTLFRRLSVFVGSFALDSAEEVCGDEHFDGYQVFDGLLQLVERSLVQVDGDGPRYRLLETIRQYGRLKLVDAGESDRVRARHLAHYIDLLQRAVPCVESGGTVEWLVRLDLEIDNIRAALEWAVTAGHSTAGLRLATVWPEYWALQGLPAEGVSRIEALIDVVEPDDALLARSLVALQTIAAYDGADLESSVSHGTRGLALARETGDLRLEGRALVYLGFAFGMLGQPTAFDCLADAVSVTQAAGDAWGEHHATNWIGYFRVADGNIAGARTVLEHNAEAERRSGDLLGLRTTLLILGTCSWLQGRPAHIADRDLTDALTVVGSLGDRIWIPLIKSIRSIVSSTRGEFDGARALTEECLRAGEDTRNLYVRAMSRWSEAWLECAIGDAASASRAAQEGAALLAVTGPKYLCSMCLTLGARAAMWAGDLDAASALLDDAEKEAAGSAPALGFALVVKALVARRAEDLRRSEDLARSALALGSELLSTPDALEVLAGVLAQQGEQEEAARHFGAADAHRRRAGAARWPLAMPEYKADVTTVRESLGEGEFARAWDEGGAMSTEEAVAYATRGRGERKRPAFGWDGLTPAERDVVKLVGAGLANKEIAARLFVSPRTVQAHLTHIYSKLNIKSRVQLANEATRHE